MKQLEVKGLKSFAYALTALVCAQIVWHDYPLPFFICLIMLIVSLVLNS